MFVVWINEVQKLDSTTCTTKQRNELFVLHTWVVAGTYLPGKHPNVLRAIQSCAQHSPTICEKLSS